MFIIYLYLLLVPCIHSNRTGLIYDNIHNIPHAVSTTMSNFSTFASLSSPRLGILSSTVDSPAIEGVDDDFFDYNHDVV